MSGGPWTITGGEAGPVEAGEAEPGLQRGSGGWGGWEGRVGEGGLQEEGRGGGLAPPGQHVLTAGSAGRKGWGLQEGARSCRERGPSPEHRPGYEAGRGKDGNEHPRPQPGFEGGWEVSLGLVGKGPGAGSLGRAGHLGSPHYPCGRRQGRDGQLVSPWDLCAHFTDA